MKYIIFLLLIFGILNACSEGAKPSDAYSFENHSWPDDLVVPFEFEVTDTTNLYDIALILRNTTDYKYSNLFVQIKMVPPYGNSSTRIYEIPIANPDGSWIGTKSGSLVENKFRLKKDTRFPFLGKYKFEVKHLITDKEVKEVMDLSMMLRKK